MAPDQARQRAKKSFRQDERARDGRKAMMAKVKTRTHLTVRSKSDVDRLMGLIRASALRVHDVIAAQSGDPAPRTNDN
jgi:hypothetical protein